MSMMALSLFCEDIRQELAGTETLVGVMSDQINIIGKPALIAKIGIYTKIYFPFDDVPESITIDVYGVDGNIIISNNCDKNVLAESINSAKSANSDRVGMKVLFVIGGIQISNSGEMKVVIRINNVHLVSGSLVINLVEIPNPVISTVGQPPSEQSPSAAPVS